MVWHVLGCLASSEHEEKPQQPQAVPYPMQYPIRIHVAKVQKNPIPSLCPCLLFSVPPMMPVRWGVLISLVADVSGHGGISSRRDGGYLP